MIVWLITSGEPLPVDNNNPRLMRTGIFSNLLAENKHTVIWWSSTFNHNTKQFRFTENTKIKLRENLILSLLHGKGYKHNISLDRIIDHRQVARNFEQLSVHETKPDIVVVSFPTPDLAMAAVKYGEKRNIPVIVDIRDLWPEIFVDVTPNKLKKIANFALSPLYSKVKLILNKATGIVGLTDAFLSIGLQKNKLQRRSSDGVFPLGYKKNIFPDEEIKLELSRLISRGIISKDKFTICFFGSIGHHSDLETVIEAAKILEKENQCVQFIFCGVGDTLAKYKALSSGLSNIFYPGYIGKKEITAIMKVSKLGIIPYKSTINYQNNITNKAIEYLSEGLPIITGLTGYFRSFVQKNKIGFIYENGDPENLVNLIKELILDQNKLIIASKYAQQLYEMDFEATKVYTNYMHHLEKVVDIYHSTKTNIYK